jgi:hypothetical protein
MLMVGKSEIPNIRFACVEFFKFICLPNCKYVGFLHCKELVPADAVIFDCGELPEGAADGVVNIFQG